MRSMPQQQLCWQWQPSLLLEMAEHVGSACIKSTFFGYHVVDLGHHSNPASLGDHVKSLIIK